MRAWIVPMGLLLGVVTLGCSSDRDPAIAEIEKLGGTYRCDEESPDKAVVDVRFNGTQVTDAGVKKLKQTFPKCEINRQGRQTPTDPSQM